MSSSTNSRCCYGTEQAVKRAIEYRQAAMEELCFPDNSFDAVFSSLAFHYVRDFTPMVENISRWLVPGGSFVFSVEHPVFTAYGSQDWYYTDPK